MAVVIQKATKGVIIAYSSNESGSKHRILNLETHFKNKPFDIKLLYNKGVDIVASGNVFVSDIVFGESVNKEHLTPEFYKVKSNYDSYLNTLKALKMTNRPHRKYGIEYYDWYKGSRIKTLDYYNHENWTLTYKMRGFTDLYSKLYPEDDKNIDGVTAYSINLILKARSHELEDYEECEEEEELEEESEYEPEQDEEVCEESEVEDEGEDDEEMDEDTDPEDEVLVKLYNTKLDDKDDKTWMHHYFGREYSPLGASKWDVGFKDCPEYNNDSFGSYSNNNFLYCLPEYLDFVKKPKGLQPEHIKALKDIDFNCVYIEHESITPKCIEVTERQLDLDLKEQSKILDLYERGSEKPYGTLIEISCSPPLTDYDLHSDEGFYEAGVNYYNNNQGIVLIGEQNMPTMFYGHAMEEGFYIPDVFYDTV